MRFVVQLRYRFRRNRHPPSGCHKQVREHKPVRASHFSSRPRQRRRASLSKTTIATASMLAGWLVNPSTLFVLLTGELDICSSNGLTELPNRT
jgi:hypothetical protein